MDGDVPQGDSGSTGQTCVQVMQKVGVCLETEDSYDVATYNDPPTAEQTTEASLYKGGAYHSISNVEDMKSCLASEYACIVGFTVYDSFEAPTTATSGLMPMPGPEESVLGGHEVLFKGYNDSIQCPNAPRPGAFSVRNSWAASWGLNGDFWFPYDGVADLNIFIDCKIQHFGLPWGA